MKKELDKSLIPKGYYCYDEKGICPYWSLNKNKPYQQNGYCSFLEKGDWNINKEIKWKEILKDGKKTKAKAAKEIGFPMSVLWDKCKECDINYD